MIDRVEIGASVTMTPPEADKLAGDGTVRLVTCGNGRVVGGVGAVGLVEHTGDTDLEAFVEEVKLKRADLKMQASGTQPENKRANLFEFINIGEP